jgi:beta-phosphoglucomutase-like phosphatase (HAD superfamily)
MRWTIVTSGNFIWQSFCTIFNLCKASNKYTPRALEQAGIPTPAAGIVTANDVAQGKPHPDPYLAGAALCSADPLKCWCLLRTSYITYLNPGLVVEDAISGLTAGRAAGALTLAVCTSTERILLVESGKPDFIVNDLTKSVFHILILKKIF